MGKETAAPDRAGDGHKPQTKKLPRSILSRYGFVSILIIAALLLALASSWLNYRFRHNMGDLAEEVEQLSARVDQLEQQVGQQKQVLTAIKATNNTLQQRLQAKENPARWRIAEALYFTRLANDSLQFHHDSETSQHLLGMADKRLRQSGDPGVASLRQQLAQAIDDLKALPQVDVSGLYGQLTALADDISQLTPQPPINALGEKKAAAPQTDEATPSSTGAWRQGLKQSMQRVWQLIIIQRHDRALAPLLTNQGYQQLNEGVLLLIRQAQWALLERQSDIYRSSLQHVTGLLTRYYDGNSQEVKPLLATISQLDAATIAVTPPSLVPLIDDLSAYIANDDRQQQVVVEGPSS